MKTRTRSAVIYLAFSLITPFAALANEPVGQTCASLNARYTMEAADGFELRFEKPAEPTLFSDLYVVVTSPNHRYVFELYTTTGYSMNSINLLNELSDQVTPAGAAIGSPIYGFDANFRAIQDLPQSDTPAAQHYFTPDLGLLFRYNQPAGEGEYLPQEMWNLASCG